ncbi:MAG: hypothetical protein M1832_005862 [Thelocarpon impressellum]|nr:MAG: hypothetical protein M1832_005862 [Thelocarpon impressellum]
MAPSVEDLWRLAQSAEKALLAKLAEKDPTFQDIDRLLTQYRTACENVIFSDFDFARGKNVEARLWDAHGRINTRFRKNIGRFRDENGKTKPVEMRKMVKHYLDFIKASQKPYRTYIRRLASHFGGIPEVEQVAHKFKSDEHAAGRKSEATPELRRMILLSCHQTLVRLGDLSRYREAELNPKDRNWGPAIGYYDLAAAIYPASGASHNQYAVIALADGNHLGATYHLYRALAAEEPHPTAEGNLEIEFKKILAAWTKGELMVNGPAGDGDAGKALLSWFVRLHARCYRGEEFSEHDELENEVLSQLAVDLKERSLDKTLHKFTLINVAAEYFAGVRVQADPQSAATFHAFFYFLRLNVKTFFTLLQVLQPELEQLVTDERNAEKGRASIGQERMTAVTRRVLPGLRHYSSWLTSNSALLVSQVGDDSLNVQIKELWKVYANSLTLLAATFRPETLPSAAYLLEEDEDTLGFKPFGTDKSKSRYFDGDQPKPRMHDAGVERHHPNVEMLVRVRDFLTDGLELAVDETVPISLVEGGLFVYQEDGLPSEVLGSPGRADETASTPSMPIPRRAEPDGRRSNGVGPSDDGLSHSVETSECASVSMSANMQHMVSSLVDNDAPSGPCIPPSAPPSFPLQISTSLASAEKDETSYEHMGTLTAAELLKMQPSYRPSPQQHQHHTPRPSLPSIYNTPFAPQPEEGSTSPATPVTARRLSPPAQQHSQAASSGSSMMRDPSSWYVPAASNPASTVYGNGNGTTFDEMPPSPYWSATQWGGARQAVVGGGMSSGRAADAWTPPNGQGGGGPHGG